MRNSRLLSAVVLGVFCIASGPALAAECRYEADPAKAAVEFTAYKFTEKKGVNGKFKKFEVTGPRSAKSVAELIKNASFTVDLTSLDTGDAGRDANLGANFFSLIKGGIRGAVKSVKPVAGTPSTGGKATVEISLGGKAQSIPMDYSVSPDKVLTLNGKVDILAYGLKEAFESLKKACNALHVGTDGKSVTWSDVSIRFRVPVTANGCS